MRLLRCAIEQVADWHPNFFTEPQTVAFVAVAMFSAEGHQIRFSKHSMQEREDGEGQN